MNPQATPAQQTLNRQNLSDRFAIGLSFLCTLHCLALPVAITLLPSLAALPMADESFHFWMLAVVIPISGFALFTGWRKHRSSAVLARGMTGLTLMILAVLIGHDLLGEAGEKGLTLLGAGLLAWAHWLNQKACRAQNCECHAD
ncbi:MAG: MerC domain-containing protein [Oceanobacter sp.]